MSIRCVSGGSADSAEFSDRTASQPIDGGAVHGHRTQRSVPPIRPAGCRVYNRDMVKRVAVLVLALACCHTGVRLRGEVIQ